MLLRRLSVRNFRNIARAEIIFNRRFNLFVGKNAQGKTNLLEAIFFVSSLRSFRTRHLSDLIGTSEDFAVIEADVERSGVEFSVRIVVSKEGRRVWLNGKALSNPEEYYGLLKAVVFVPDDLLLVKGEPRRRRRFLDSTVFQVKPSYAKLLADFNRALRQRNAALAKRVNDFSDAVFAAYTDSVVKLGVAVALERQKAVKALSEETARIVKAVSGGSERVELVYKSGIAQDLPTDANEIAKIYKQKLKENFEKERQRGLTLVGPQRDDLVVLLDGKPMAAFASQGQHRSVVVALKAAQMRAIANFAGEEPILLLDDLSSELDLSRRGLLFDALLGSGSGQMFLTTTERSIANLLPTAETSVFVVQNGVVKKEH